MPDRFRLRVHSSPFNSSYHMKSAQIASHFKRLFDGVLPYEPGKSFLHRFIVNPNTTTLTLIQAHSGYRGLSLTRSIIILFIFVFLSQNTNYPFSIVCDVCATCGWTLPEYTLSLPNICFPNLVAGSIPLTANVRTLSGLLSIIFFNEKVLRFPVYPLCR